MSKHRADVPVNTNTEQPEGRHRRPAVPRVHWFNTCASMVGDDTLAASQEQVTCEFCQRELARY
jgi:hypothetical protein